MTDYVGCAEMYDFIIEEIYKNLLALRNAGVLDNHDVDVINSSLRSKFNDWCLDNMNHEQYTKYILHLFDRVREELENDAPKGDLNARMYDVATHPYEEEN